MDIDFLKMDLNKLFLEKHGERIFDEITNQIMMENSNKDSQDSIELVFKVAFFDFIGLKESITEKLIKDTILEKDVNVKKIKSVHKSSIKEIKKYLQISTEEINAEK